MKYLSFFLFLFVGFTIATAQMSMQLIEPKTKNWVYYLRDGGLYSKSSKTSELVVAPFTNIVDSCTLEKLQCDSLFCYQFLGIRKIAPTYFHFKLFADQILLEKNEFVYIQFNEYAPYNDPLSSSLYLVSELPRKRFKDDLAMCEFLLDQEQVFGETVKSNQFHHRILKIGRDKFVNNELHLFVMNQNSCDNMVFYFDDTVTIKSTSEYNTEPISVFQLTVTDMQEELDQTYLDSVDSLVRLMKSSFNPSLVIHILFESPVDFIYDNSPNLKTPFSRSNHLVQELNKIGFYNVRLNSKICEHDNGVVIQINHNLNLLFTNTAIE